MMGEFKTSQHVAVTYGETERAKDVALRDARALVARGFFQAGYDAVELRGEPVLTMRHHNTGWYNVPVRFYHRKCGKIIRRGVACGLRGGHRGQHRGEDTLLHCDGCDRPIHRVSAIRVSTGYDDDWLAFCWMCIRLPERGAP